MSDEAPSSGLGRSLKHELRTPLNHIIGYCEMLIEDAQDRGHGAVIPDLERIHTAGRRLLAVINDLFDPDKAPAYRTDPSLLDHEVRTPLNQIIGYAELLQEDAPEFAADLGKIHAAARRLLDQVVEHFGENRVVLKVPAASVPAAAPRASVATAAQTGRILVVDDDAGNRDMLLRRLIRLGHTVEVAENGRRALEMLEREPFDLMLLDLQMPDINGYEVLEKVRADDALRDLPVIVLSASDETSRVAHCIEMGAADYLAKHSVEPGARLLVFSDGVFEIFLERDRVQTWEEFASGFDRTDFAAMNPIDRLKHAQQLRGAEILEDDFSLIEIRFP